MNKNILILSGSPRKGGTTDKLVAAFKEGAESAGNKVTLFRTADLAIADCLGCNYCIDNNGTCIHKDDMVAILDVFRNADAVVFASPVYWYTVSAQLKSAIDRTYAVPNDKTTIKRSALLLTCADGPEDHAEAGAVAMFKGILTFRKWEDAGTVLVTNLHNISDIDGREELEQARELGRGI